MGATDDEIQAIIDQAEPGIADALAAYESVEAQYFTAANSTPAQPAVVYTSSSS